MEIVRTVKLKLDTDSEVIKRSVQTWNDACNYASQIAFDHGQMSNSVKLHKLAYHDLRDKFGQTAQVTASVIKQVAAKYQTLRTQKVKVKQPIRFKRSAVCLQGGKRERDFGFKQAGISLTTIDGRVKGIQHFHHPKLNKYLSDPDWTLGDGRLWVSRSNKVYLAVSFKKQVKPVEKPNDAVIGVDRGINNIAVVTDGQRVKFFGGKRLKHIRNRYQKTRASLQKKKAQKNTRSLRRVLKRQSGKQARFTKDAMHVVSRRIVDFAKETGNPTIAIEALKGISSNGKKMRKAQRKDLNEWPAYILKELLEYKVQDEGFEIIEINPKYTSQGCCRCGYIHKSNRNGHRFLCKACQYELHSDANASFNIRLRGILYRQSLVQDGLPSTSP